MSTNFIPIQEAAESRFESSTTEELQFYLTELGEGLNSGDTQAMLRSRVLSAMGLTDAAGQLRRGGASTARVNDNDPIRPPYNLTPNGLWGGRRIRVKLPRPEGAKLGRAEGIGWNGKATYWLGYDTVEAIPFPIYEILKDRKRRIVGQQKTRNADGSEETTTKWEFTDFALLVYGEDPMTKDRAGSLTEWYQGKGPNWFKKRTTRELQTIAQILEVPLQKGDTFKTSKTDEELCGDIFVALYGSSDVIDSKDAKAE